MAARQCGMLMRWTLMSMICSCLHVERYGLYFVNLAEELRMAFLIK